MRKKILFLIAFFLVASGVTGTWVWHELSLLKKPVALSRPVLFDVPPGTPFREVARDMQRDGLISDALWLRVWTRLQGESRQLQAGEYQFKPGMSALDMLRRMLAGKTKTWPIRLIEGWTFAEDRKALDEDPQIEHSTRSLTRAQIMQALGHPGQDPEGRFFPDTYLVKRGQSDLSVLRRAYERMQAVLAQQWAKRQQGLPLKTPYQALILASIVEKETGEPGERAKIAGVFTRRLEKGMRLQTDPTVIYGLGPKFNGDLTRKELNTATPYNTYRHRGLPPTPIAMPGQASIHAVLHPAPGKALYFVARGDGSHVFSDSLAAHDRAVRKYQIQDRSKHYHSAPEEQSQQ